MDVLKTKYNLGGIERSDVLWHLLKMTDDLHEIPGLNVLHVHVDNPLVLSHPFHL